MKIKTYISLILILLTLLFSYCYRFRHLPPEERLNKLVEYLKNELDLTESQYQELLRIKNNIQQRYQQLEKSPFWFDDNFLKQFEDGKINKEEVKKQVREFHMELMENRLKDIEEIYPFYLSLNPEQRKKLVALIQEHKEHFKRHRKGYYK